MSNPNSHYATRKLKFSRTSWLLIIGIVFIASTMRSPITTVGPLISFIRDSLALQNVLAGLLTTIPLLAFALISPFVPKLARRYGLEKTLFLSLILLTGGIIFRSFGTISSLLLGTFLLGVAIAFANVLLPSLVKFHFPLQLGLLTGVYSVAMNLSAAIAVGVSVPLATNPALGWKGALGIWGLLALIALLVWIPQIIKPKTIFLTSKPTGNQKQTSLWKSPLAWSITVFMGLQSLLFYTMSAWMSDMLISQGLSIERAGWMISLLQFAQLPIMFLIPILAGKVKDQRMIVAGTATLYVIGYGGVFMGNNALVPLWMILIGIAGAAAFGLAMMFFTLRTRTAHEAADLSGMAQSFGYLLAATGPVLFGFLHDLTAGWKVPIIIMLITASILLLAGLKAGKNEYVY